MKAKNTPLRDYMLELHRRGIKVTFHDGKPRAPGDRSQMFFVEMPPNVDISEYAEILKNINDAINSSVEEEAARPKQKLTRQVASEYISRLKLFNESSGRNN